MSKNFFLDYGVSTVIAIDDAFINIDENNKFSEFSEELIESLKSDDNYDDFLAYFSRGRENKSLNDFLSQNPIGYESLLKELNQLNKEQKGESSYNFFRELVTSDGLKYREFPPTEDVLEKLSEYIDSLGEPDSTKKILIVLDREFTTDTSGLFKKIAESISRDIESKNLLLTLYSNKTPSPPIEDYESVVEHLRNEGIADEISNKLALHFNFIEKTGDSNVLEKNLKENIMKSQKASYINEYSNIFNDSFKELKKRIWELNKNQSLFYYDYLQEGQHIDDILYNIFSEKFNAQYLDVISHPIYHEKLINPIRKSMQRYSEGVDKVDINAFRLLKELEYNIKKEELPVISSSDIAFGDIIEVRRENTVKKYLILSQDCDIVTRQYEKGKRKLKSYQLVEIKKDRAQNISEKWIYDKLYEIFKEKKDHIRKALEHPQIQDGFTKLNISQENLKNICAHIDNDENVLSLDSLNGLVYHNDYKINKNALYSIPCEWLDSLLLRRGDGASISYTEENIKASNEIRLATKKNILTALKKTIKKLGGNSKETTDAILEYTLSALAINCESIYENQNLKGFKLHNIERRVRLNRLETMRFLREVTNHETRIPSENIISI
ncbi:TPA: hypothetical protein U0J99_001772 [Streptococcus suis]|nr:hypothetical protein [Streptococcus suis]